MADRWHEIGTTVYSIGWDAWLQYYAAALGVVALAAGVVIGALGRESLLQVLHSYRNTSTELLHWLIQKGNIVARRRRRRHLMTLAEDFLTDGFESLYAEGKITIQEKQMMYRRLGISLALDGLLPTSNPTRLKEAILRRLKMGLHYKVSLPDGKKTMLAGLLESKKPAA